MVTGDGVGMGSVRNVGTAVGVEGAGDGAELGEGDGGNVGLAIGSGVGDGVGELVGGDDGSGVGALEGAKVVISVRTSADTFVPTPNTSATAVHSHVTFRLV